MINTVIFDLGGVLIDWNPKYVYRKVFNNDEEKVDWFLNTVCTMEWNMAHDAGRPIKEGTDLLISQFPQYEEWIRMYYNLWPNMLGGAIHDTVDILKKLKATGNYKIYALTNWSAETFPIALERFDFLELFEGIVVSGDEKTRKPYKDIYETTLNRYKIKAEKAVFIDDSEKNIIAANECNIHGIHFQNATQLRTELTKLNITF